MRARGMSEILERRLCLTLESATSGIAVDTNSELIFQSAASASSSAGISAIVYSDRDSVSGKGKDVYVRRFSAAGTALAAPVMVNSTTSGAQMSPHVAMNASGAFVVVWQSEGQDGSGWGVYARRFNSAGVAQGGEILVNTATSGAQTSPDVAIDSSGNFVVAYVNEASGNGEVLAKRFDAAGTALGEVTVSGATTKAYSAPTIASLGNGAFAVAWVMLNLDTDNSTDIQARAYTSSGATSGTTQTISDAGDQSTPSLAAGTSRFTLAWADASGTEGTILFRHFTTAGAFANSVQQANQDSIGHRTGPSVAVDANDNVVLGWTQQEQNAFYSSTVYRTFDASGNATSNEMAVTDGSSARTLFDVSWAGQGRFLDVATLGEFVGYGIASTSALKNVLRLDGTSGADNIVMYDLNATTIRTGVNGVTQNFLAASYAHIRVELGDGNDRLTATDITLWATVSGGAGNDTIYTGEGFDSISGGEGNDFIDAGGGSDYVIGNAGNDIVYGGEGDDTLTGSSGKDTMYGGNGDDRVAGTGSPDVLFGEAGNDRVYGDDGDDIMDGGGGKDRAYGGEGNDFIVGGSSNDRLFGQNGNDTLGGGKGNDYLAGDAGIDTVLGKEPGDTLVDVEIY